MIAMKSGLTNLHNDYFTNRWETPPVNITTVIQGGFYLPQTQTVNESAVVPSDNVTAWLEAYASARLINQLFGQNDYYIVYVSVETHRHGYSDADFYRSLLVSC